MSLILLSPNSTNYFPKLRFPGFSDEWKRKKLEEVGEVINGLTYNPSNIDESGILVLRSSNVQNRSITLTDNVYVKTNNYNAVKENDILICVRNGSKNLIGKNAIIEKHHEGLAFGAFMTIYRSDFNKFLFQWFDTKEYKDIINKNLGATINSINGGDLKKFKVPFPSIEEQNKISAFLSSLDSRIQLSMKTIENLESLKSSLLNKIFKRKNEFYKNKNWEERQLAQISHEHQDKNKKNLHNEVFSVAKNKGVINQIEHLGRSFSASDISNYKLIYPGDLVYTKSPTSDFPFGIIKQNRTNRIGVVSPLYCVFTPQSFALGYLIHEYFESAVNTFNYLNPLVQKGAKNTMNINNDTFLNGAELFLPIDEREQEKLYKLFSSVNQKIEIESRILEKLNQQKKYFLQNLFV